MAGPVAAFVQLPLDTGNTGKKMRTQSRVVGADTVHEHFFIPISIRKIEGMYFFVMALLSTQATAHNGTSTAHFWLELPSGGTRRCRLRHLEIAHGHVLEADMLTAPRVALARFTFTGAASGATITPGKRDSRDSANVANVRTASTGMTVTVGALMWATLTPVLALTTSGMLFNVTISEYEPTDEDAYMDWGPAEGILLYQPDAGTASDSRRLVVAGRWDEYDNA